MSLSDFVTKNLYTDNPLIQAICIGFLFVIVYDFYHLLHSAILSWFKR